MNRSFKAALLGLALAGGSLAGSHFALADSVTVTTRTDGIAFGYNDGYWDRAHNWNAWKRQEDAAKWREENREHYYEREHDAEQDQGWHDSDHWWDKK